MTPPTPDLRWRAAGQAPAPGGTTTRPPPPPGSGARPSGRRRPGRRWRLATLALVVALLAGGTWWAVDRWAAPADQLSAEDFQPFSTNGPFALRTSGDSVVLPAPEADYTALRGAFAARRLCDGQLDLDFRAATPTRSSPGFGFAVAPHGSVTGGTPAGHSVQFEWNGSDFVTREVLLPDQSTATSESFASTFRPDTWHHLAVLVRDGSASFLLDGRPIVGSPVALGDRCGGLLLRAWGTAVEVRAIRFIDS